MVLLAEAPPALRTVLHVGCGAPDPRKLPPAFFAPGEWREVRLDIDPAVAPVIEASITDMAAVDSASVDAVWSAHNLEHLFAHEVPSALVEFRRVLCPGGFALVTVPDLQQAAALMQRGASQPDGVPYVDLARYHWGVALIEGRGVPADPAEGRRWLQKAASAGEPAASEYLQRLDGALQPRQ